MKNVVRYVAGLALGAAMGFAALGAYANETPATLKGVTVVTADQVKKMMDSGTPVIDTRVANEFAEAHIKGAKSVPYREKSAKAMDFDATADSFDVSKLPS